MDLPKPRRSFTRFFNHTAKSAPSQHFLFTADSRPDADAELFMITRLQGSGNFPGYLDAERTGNLIQVQHGRLYVNKEEC